jgi:hypothetical protein
VRKAALIRRERRKKVSRERCTRVRESITHFRERYIDHRVSANFHESAGFRRLERVCGVSWLNLFQVNQQEILEKYFCLLPVKKIFFFLAAMRCAVLQFVHFCHTFFEIFLFLPQYEKCTFFTNYVIFF